MQFKNNSTRNSQIALGFASCNYLTVTGKIILELHSNVCDYLYKFYQLSKFNGSLSSMLGYDSLPSLSVLSKVGVAPPQNLAVAYAYSMGVAL